MSTCALSGVVPEQPVVAKTTGYIFEKRLITKHLEINQSCPITHTPLVPSDLIPIQTTATVVPPRPPTATSFPQLLTTLQNEYDAMLLETFSLRQQLDLVKKDLAKQYYTLDAANRVIARLYKENKDLKSGLESANPASRLIQSTQQQTHHQQQQQQQHSQPALLAPQNLSFDPTQFITAEIELARTKLSGKANRSVVTKHLAATLPKSSAFINARIDHNSTLTIGSATKLLPTTATTQYTVPTAQTLQNLSATASGEQITFIPTDQNSVIVVQNNPTKQQEHPAIITTITLPTPPNHSTIFTTGLITTHLNIEQFPWVGNLIRSDTGMGDDAVRPSTVPAFIVTTSSTTNQHTIYIYACSSFSETTTASNWKCLHTIKTATTIKSLILHPSQALLITLSANYTIDLYNLKKPSHVLDLTSGGDYTAAIKSIPVPTDPSTFGFPITLSPHPDCTLIGVGFSQRGNFQLLNLLNEQFNLFTQPDATNFVHPVTQIEFPVTATSCAAVSIGNGFQLWNIAKQLVEYSEKSPDLSAFTYDQTGTFVFAAMKNVIHIYGTKSNEKIATIALPKDDAVVQKLIVQEGNRAVLAITQKECYVVYPRLE